jgi:Multidrug resistance efflux pump
MTREKDSKLGFAVLQRWECSFWMYKGAARAAVAADIPVIVAKASQQAMPVEVTSVGNVEAISTVSVRSQVAGPLLEVHFKEGDFVHKGQLLLTIDPRPYQAQVEAAKGAIVRDQADEKQAEASLAKDSARKHMPAAKPSGMPTCWRRDSFPKRLRNK